jgi:ubiquinone/menaquinone biosynthesis C-methylase UbiE
MGWWQRWRSESNAAILIWLRPSATVGDSSDFDAGGVTTSALVIHQLMAGEWWDGLVGVFSASSGVPDSVAYMDAAAATPAGVEYKQRLLAALQLHAGQVAVDIGCGPGTDLDALAARVGRQGMVIGVDREPRMIGEACRRSAAQPTIRCCVGDIHQLPLPNNRVDRARTDRVLQHVRDPATAIGQVRRILRPGGLFGMAEPDWDTLAVIDEDADTSCRFARFLASRVRNATIGRDLGRLCADADLRVRSVEPIAVLFGDFGTADQILGLQRNTARAVAAGAILEAPARAWLTRLAHSTVATGFTVYLVIAEA